MSRFRVVWSRVGAGRRDDMEGEMNEHEQDVMNAMDEQARREVDEAVRRDLEEQERQEAEDAAAREAEVAAHARRVRLGTRQAQVLATCVQALDALALETVPEDEAYVAEARDRVLRAARANFFDAPASPLMGVLESLQEHLPEIVAQVIKMQTPPIVETRVPSSPKPSPFTFTFTRDGAAPSPTETPTPDLRVGDRVMTPLGVMELVMTQAGLALRSVAYTGSPMPPPSSFVGGSYTATSDGRVTPPFVAELAKEIARRVHDAVIGGDEPEEFVANLMYGAPAAPAGVLAEVCAMSDEAICAHIAAVSPGSAGATPAGQKFVRDAMKLLRAKI